MEEEGDLLDAVGYPLLDDYVEQTDSLCPAFAGLDGHKAKWRRLIESMSAALDCMRAPWAQPFFEPGLAHLSQRVQAYAYSTLASFRLDLSP